MHRFLAVAMVALMTGCASLPSKIATLPSFEPGAETVHLKTSVADIELLRSDVLASAKVIFPNLEEPRMRASLVAQLQKIPGVVALVSQPNDEIGWIAPLVMNQLLSEGKAVVRELSTGLPVVHIKKLWRGVGGSTSECIFTLPDGRELSRWTISLAQEAISAAQASGRPP